MAKAYERTAQVPVVRERFDRVLEEWVPDDGLIDVHFDLTPRGRRALA